LYRGLKKQQVYRPDTGWRQFFLQICLAGTVLCAVLFWGTPATQVWLDWSVWSRVFGLFVWILAGAGAYFIALHLAGLRLMSLWQRRHDGD
jgi:putative peptidoglycan lipid II flippase